MKGKKSKSMASRVREKAKSAEFSGGGGLLQLKESIQFYKLKKGRQELVIVPFTMTNPKNRDDIGTGESWFTLPYLRHYGIGAEQKNVVCPRTFGQRCPICEHRQFLLDKGKDRKDQEIKDLAAKERNLYNVIDLADDTDKVKILDVSYYLFGQKLWEEVREADDDSPAARFADVEDGAVIQLRMKEKSFGGNTFLEASRIDFVERAEDLDQDILDQAVAFDKALVVLSYDELKAMLFDLDSPDDNEDVDEDEAPAKNSRFSKAKEQAEPEDEDDEPSVKPKENAKKQVVEDEDEDDDEPPAKPKKPAKKPMVEDNDEDDDESPPPPKKKQAKQADDDCPEGAEFGTDCDTIAACAECDCWDACDTRRDELESASKKKKK